jgi:hypothetical protein
MFIVGLNSCPLLLKLVTHVSPVNNFEAGRGGEYNALIHCYLGYISVKVYDTSE